MGLTSKGWRVVDKEWKVEEKSGGWRVEDKEWKVEVESEGGG